MSVLGAVLAALLLVAEVVLIARMVLSWTVVLAGTPAAGSLRAQTDHAVYAVTEPVLAPVRRVLPAVRIGPVALDLAFIVVFVAVVLLRSIALSL